VKAIAKHKPNARALAADLLFGFLTVDHPRDAEAIRDDAKAECPESLLEWHANRSSFR